MDYRWHFISFLMTIINSQFQADHKVIKYPENFFIRRINILNFPDIMVDSPLNTGPTGILPSLTNTNFQQMESKVLTGIYSRGSNVRYFFKKCSMFECSPISKCSDVQCSLILDFLNVRMFHNVRTLEYSKYECSLFLKCSNVRQYKRR